MVMKAYLKSAIALLSRRKYIDLTTPSNLKRCLGTLDLTALGVGATLGVGTYVLAGSISKFDAGPAVCISMAIAAFASVFAGLCYAEFGTRVPKAGSAYVYGYVCVGEFVAFILGWSMLLSYGIGVSSVAKGYSNYVDSIMNNEMSRAFKRVAGMEIYLLAEYVDFFAFGVTALLSIILCFGMKESTKLNTLFTLLNVSVILFVLIGGAWHVNIDNWSIDKNTISNQSECFCGENDEAQPEDHNWCGEGGFAPYGIDGIIRGAATAFYGFVGFDVIATMGEEVINPQKMMPVAIILSLTIIFLAYFGLSAVVTLILPYYLQNINAPIPAIFTYVGWNWAAWIVRIGALMGLSASLMGGIVPLPRVIWAMASDGLLFKFLSRVNPKFQTPVNATLLSGLIFGLMAAIFNLDVLMDFMSIGTLLAYTMVSACVIILRYRQTEEDILYAKEKHIEIETKETRLLDQILNLRNLTVPSSTSSSLASLATLIIGIDSFILCSILANFREEIVEMSTTGIILTLLLLLLILILVVLTVIIRRQPQSVSYVAFKVPLVPFIPVFSILLNTYLMASLDAATWGKFALWNLLGLTIYFGYGIWNSNANSKSRNNMEMK